MSTKKITVVNDKWFSTAPIEDVMSLGLRVLDIPVANLSGKDEKGQRTLVRQMFKQREEFDFGQEFEITELDSNPFKKKGAAMHKKTPRTPIGQLTGPYKVVKCRMRADGNDPKWELWGLVATHHDFDALFKVFDEQYKDKKFHSSGASTFSAKEFAQWALKCGWIIKV